MIFHQLPSGSRRGVEKDFIRAHMAVLVATDFFTVEVLTLRGLMTYYVLFFIHWQSRRAAVLGNTPHDARNSRTSIGVHWSIAA